MAFWEKARISLMARGARFLKAMPCTCAANTRQSSAQCQDGGCIIGHVWTSQNRHGRVLAFRGLMDVRVCGGGWCIRATRRRRWRCGFCRRPLWLSSWPWRLEGRVSAAEAAAGRGHTVEMGWRARGGGGREIDRGLSIEAASVRLGKEARAQSGDPCASER
jgi:hypothetical protein